MTDKIVIKIGGSYLGTDLSKYNEIAGEIIGLDKKVVLVMSAQSGETDRLLAVAAQLYGCSVDELKQSPEVDELIVAGESRSCKYMKIALRRLGIDSEYYHPHNPDFPIRVEHDGKVKSEESYWNIREKVQKAWAENKIPIIPGFVGRNSHIMTLGRNSWDYSAIIVANSIEADFVVKLGYLSGVSDGNGGYLKEIHACDLDSHKWTNGHGYKKYDCIFDQRGIEIAHCPIYVTNSLHDKGTVIVPKHNYSKILSLV